jgi:16S rRNA (guanine1207-N2)-methyltransferase
MKDYKRLLDDYERLNVAIVQHQWGQSRSALYNDIVRVWNRVDVGSKIAIISNEKFGIKSAVRFLSRYGLNPQIVGKGVNGLRVAEVIKDGATPLSIIDARRIIRFGFLNHNYEINVGEATFSKTGLDAGTRFLLEVVFEAGIDFDFQRVGDFGCGWGAIAMVIANECPEAKILAYENEAASLEAARLNLEMYPNVCVQDADILCVGEFAALDYIVANPPFHIREEEREAFFTNARNALKEGGGMFFVAEGSFVERFRTMAKRFFTISAERNNGRYVVFCCENSGQERARKEDEREGLEATRKRLGEMNVS